MSITVTLWAQAFTFALFIWFTVKFVWPHVLRAIETRQKTIADGLAAAEQGRRSLELSTRQADEAIKEARARAAEILAQTAKRSAQLIEEARQAAKEEGGRELAAAKAEIEQEVTRAREELRACRSPGIHQAPALNGGAQHRRAAIRRSRF
jgi:F-type H+-transporting ATPase subunit b